MLCCCFFALPIYILDKSLNTAKLCTLKRDNIILMSCFYLNEDYGLEMDGVLSSFCNVSC